MEDNKKLELIINKFKNRNVNKSIISSIINEYNTYPLYVIKYITVYYAEITAECIVEYIVNTKDRRCELMNCILTSHNIKLCETSIINEISCVKKCDCYSRKIWINMYKIFLKVIKNDHYYFLSSLNFYNSFALLLSQTDVLDNDMIEFIRTLIRNPKNWQIIIRVIIDAELYSSNYGDLIFMMRDLILDNDKLEDSKKNKYISEFTNRVLLGTVLRRYNNVQKSISRISDTLYLSDISAAKNVAILREKNIQCVITITKKSIFMLSGIEYTHLMIDDIATVNFIESTLPTVLQTIKQLHKNKTTLVHCYKGMSRSVCFVILVLIYQGMNFNEAYASVKNKKPNIDPNPEFVRQIIQHFESM
jgi:predicted protein tyrosine phosphatase